MRNSIYPCLWFNGNAKDAMQFYCDVFPESKIVTDTPMVVNAELCGQLFMGLNGGPMFTPNASISFMVICETTEETDNCWHKLAEGGTVLMPLDKYEWSERYGWVQDKFGISWQIYKGDISEVGQKIVPTLMFAQEQQGKAKQAIHFYIDLFKQSSLAGIMEYGFGPTEGQVQHAQFTLNNYVVMAMDSGVPQTFSFTEGISLVFECETQDEIDYYWNGFTKQGEESKCGWCKDQFGVSWQIIPKVLSTLMSNPERAQRVMQQILKMNKLDIATLENA